VKAKLKQDAIPTQFPNLPHYFTKSMTRRSETTTSSARFQRQLENHELEVSSFLLADKIETLEELGKIILNAKLQNSGPHFCWV